MKNNKLNRNVNKVITLTMAGAVALSAPLSFVYASPDASEEHEYTDIHGVCDICGETKEDGNHFTENIDDGIIEIDPNDTENDKKDDDVIIVDTCDEDHIEYPFLDLDNDGFCDNCGAEKKENTETEIPEEKNLKDFTFFIKGYTASDEDITNIYNKLKTDGKYKLSYSDNKTEKDLKVKVNIYNNNDEIIDNFVLSNSDNIIKNLPDKNEQGYEQFSCKYELVAENLHYTKNGKYLMYSSIITEDGEIPVLKLFQLTPCISHGIFESPIHIEKELGIVCDYNSSDFDLDLFLENEEIKDFLFKDVALNKDCCCESGIPDLPDLPDIPETSETTESTETSETTEEKPSTETSEEKPSTETSETTEEKPSTETSEEKPSTETSETTEEKPSTETSEEKPSTETSETTEEKPSTETSEEKPSTETSETTEEKPSTETSEEKPSTETSETTEEKPSTETTTTPTPEPVKPVNPTPKPVKPVEPTPTTETTTTTTTITEDRGKVDPSETVKNEMVQTGDIATNTYYGGYFLATAFGVLTAFFKKFKK